MKHFISIIALWIMISVCHSQTVYVGGSAQIQMENLSKNIAVGAKVDYQLSKMWWIGIDIDISLRNEIRHNVLYSTSVDFSQWMHTFPWRVKARGGFGWGHYYTNDMTDHNYHTYQIGIIFERRISPSCLLFVHPSINARTYAEHIGFARDRAWMQLQLGLSFDI